jgi:hypothetical protein
MNLNILMQASSDQFFLKGQINSLIITIKKLFLNNKIIFHIIILIIRIIISYLILRKGFF